MSIYIGCVNCGKQVIMDNLGENCYWCGKPANKVVKDEIGSNGAHYARNLPPLKAESIQYITKD